MTETDPSSFGLCGCGLELPSAGAKRCPKCRAAHARKHIGKRARVMRRLPSSAPVEEESEWIACNLGFGRPDVACAPSRTAVNLLDALKKDEKLCREFWLTHWKKRLENSYEQTITKAMVHSTGSEVRRRRLVNTMPTLVTVVVFGVVIGWLDVSNTEVQVPVGALLLSGFVVGLRRPPYAWAWASILGFSVPAAQAVSLLTGFKPPYSNDSGTVLEAFLAFIPALLGTYGGSPHAILRVLASA